MSLRLENLEEVRELMVEEIDRDIATGKLYLSSRLSARGLDAYQKLLREAAGSGSEVGLAAQISAAGRLNTTEIKRTPSGGQTSAAVPVTAAETLAEGEFNRFYLRGLCRLAIERGIAQVEVYRAKHVQNARSASRAKIGTHVNAETLLEDLRRNVGLDTALGLPGGPNSGLSARLPRN